jgi:DNA-binding CsgD family transcriptional regulator
LALRQGDPAAARGRFAAGLRAAQAAGFRWRAVEALEGLAAVAAGAGRAAGALRLAGAAAAVREGSEMRPAPAEREEVERWLAPARRALRAEAAAAAWAAGQALSLDEAVAAALEDEPASVAPARCTRGETGAGGRGRGRLPGGLTAREAEVLRLVTQGLTDRQIAAALVLSEKTVGRHLDNAYAKLGVSSRAAATAFALRAGLA